ncbi:MAG: orotidine 5'-phosphate decarboxylase [Planctomycetota bacterium]|nr:MAG: orotidine 5'-phosphate decarboxylase [Planctomycetota bacterium]
MKNFADRLLAAIEDKGAPVCVGLDPVWGWIPAEVRDFFEQDECEHEPGSDEEEDCESCGDEPQARKAAALVTYCDEVLEIVAPRVPAVKINIAFFEAHGPAGVLAYSETVRAALERDLIVIGDVKRGDIGHTSEHYAAAHLREDPEAAEHPRPDAVTVNPYFGVDGVAPFLDAARGQGKGVFILAQTSNKSATEVQGLKLADGRTVREAVAGLIHGWACNPGLLGKGGYSAVGAVVSPTDRDSTLRLRELMPNCFFLVPGWGAQGQSGADAAACFNRDGRGAIVTSSRGVMFPWTAGRGEAEAPSDWRGAIQSACDGFVRDVRSALPGRF